MTLLLQAITEALQDWNNTTQIDKFPQHISFTTKECWTCISHHYDSIYIKTLWGYHQANKDKLTIIPANDQYLLEQIKEAIPNHTPSFEPTEPNRPTRPPQNNRLNRTHSPTRPK